MSGKEKRFLDALEALFTGAEVEGESGFINLMRIKRGYFQSIRPRLMEAIDARAAPDTAFREELFDKLYTFFSRYFCESGSIYFRHLPAFSKTYERVYADGEEVALTWKTRDLYYVKSDVLVKSMPVTLQGDRGPAVHFYFDASEVEHKQNNERREFVFDFEGIERNLEGKREIHLKVSYSRRGKKTKTDDILRHVRKAGIRLSDKDLHKAIAVFKRQTEADYFINKDAGGFLRQQFDLWLYQYMFQAETVFQEDRLAQLQAIRDTAYDVIDFIAQFEDELRRVWEKPKFIRAVHYVVTLDKLPADLLTKIARHPGIQAQIQEWRQLGLADEAFTRNSITDNAITDADHQYLPLDTKHFKDLEQAILKALGNLDEVLDGELVHSENWQALNTLQRRYKGKVKCIYIDPPYNAPSSEVIYKNGYKHSTFLSLICERVLLSKSFMRENTVHVMAIDENEQERIGILLKSIFSDMEHTIVTIVSNPSGQQGDNFSYCHEFAYFAYPNKKRIIGLENREEKPDVRPLRDVSKGDHLRTDARNCFYPIYVKNGKIVGIGDVCSDSFHPSSANVQRSDGTIEIYPIDSQGNERKWVFARNSVEDIIDELSIEHNKSRDIWDVIRTKSKFNYKTVWTDKKYSANSNGTKLLNNILTNNTFKFPKSIYTVMECVKAAMGRSTNDTVLDYFAGSGTTAHAVINLNQQDGGRRKYILVEMGDYFHTVLLPRIKKIVYSKDWKDGKPVSREGVSQCFKYYTLEQYEETLRKARYEDGEQLELDSQKSPFEQYVFFGDDKLAHAVTLSADDTLEINLHDLYPDLDVAESLANILGKTIRTRTEDAVTFTDGGTEKIDPATMTEEQKQHFLSLLKPYLWWGK